MKRRPLSEVLPKQGLVYSEIQSLEMVHCKPKVMPIRSFTLAQIQECEERAKSCFLALGWGVPPEEAEAPSKPNKPMVILPVSMVAKSPGSSPTMQNIQKQLSPLAHIQRAIDDLQVLFPPVSSSFASLSFPPCTLHCPPHFLIQRQPNPIPPGQHQPPTTKACRALAGQAPTATHCLGPVAGP